LKVAAGVENVSALMDCGSDHDGSEVKLDDYFFEYFFSSL
jgi:hypothetical protein